MEKFLISMDSGKFNSKAVFEVEGETTREIFRTIKRNEFNDANGINVIFNGEECNIGDETLEASDDNFELAKSSDLHKICTLVMIAKALKKAGRNAKGEEVALTISMPLMQFFNQKRREEMETTYKGNHKIEVELDGEMQSFEFNITDTSVIYETGGVVVRHSSDFAGKNVILLDAGGLNVTWLTLTNGKADRDKSGINDWGSHSLIGEIQERVYNATGRKVSATDTLAALNREFEFRGQYANEINEIVATTFEEVMKDIHSSMKKKVDVTSYEVFFVGGSSTLYRDELTRVLNARAYKQSNDPIFDHVTGCYLLLKKKVG